MVTRATGPSEPPTADPPGDRDDEPVNEGPGNDEVSIPQSSDHTLDQRQGGGNRTALDLARTDTDEKQTQPVCRDPALASVFACLRSKMGHDFSLYKSNTIGRRIERRIKFHELPDLAAYAQYLGQDGNDGEVQKLFQELLIGVTSFFRDQDAWVDLESRLLEKVASKPRGSYFRVWVAGCASGEEAYSIAIALYECIEQLSANVRVQVFGTDIDPMAIERARQGVFPAMIAENMSMSRIDKHFVRQDDGQYRAEAAIRETLIFAVQNVAADPPFTRLDLVCCRNLLIYLGSELQSKVLPVFHYSLVSHGLLFLGSSESIAQADDLFELVNKKWKIFRRLPGSSEKRVLSEFQVTQEKAPTEARARVRARPEARVDALEMVQALLDFSSMPPCVVVDDRFEVLYVHGRTGQYLELPAGHFSKNVVKMARLGLELELASALREVERERTRAVRKGLEIYGEDGNATFDLEVRPILEQNARARLMLIVFVNTAGQDQCDDETATNTAFPRDLARELLSTRESLETSIEELETSNEELKSSNEELQSMNEELQSTNEELETSKEELQSMNEESVTVNSDLQSRNDAMSKANDDMKNLLDSTDIATLFLDADLNVCRFTPRTTRIIPLSNADIGRSLAHFACGLRKCNLVKLSLAVLGDLETRECIDTDGEGRSYTVRVRPYRTTQNVVEGVVVTFEDVTELERRLAMAVAMADSPRSDPNSATPEQLRAPLTALSDGDDSPLTLAFDRAGTIVLFDPGCQRLTGYNSEDIVGKRLAQTGIVDEDEPDAHTSDWDVESVSRSRPRSRTSRWHTKRGSPVDIVWSESLILSPEGNAEYCVASGVVLSHSHNSGSRGSSEK